MAESAHREFRAAHQNWFKGPKQMVVLQESRHSVATCRANLSAVPADLVRIGGPSGSLAAFEMSIGSCARTGRSIDTALRRSMVPLVSFPLAVRRRRAGIQITTHLRLTRLTAPLVRKIPPHAPARFCRRSQGSRYAGMGATGLRRSMVYVTSSRSDSVSGIGTVMTKR